MKRLDLVNVSILVLTGQCFLLNMKLKTINIIMVSILVITGQCFLSIYVFFDGHFCNSFQSLLLLDNVSYSIFSLIPFYLPILRQKIRRGFPLKNGNFFLLFPHFYMIFQCSPQVYRKILSKVITKLF